MHALMAIPPYASSIKTAGRMRGTRKSSPRRWHRNLRLALLCDNKCGQSSILMPPLRIYSAYTPHIRYRFCLPAGQRGAVQYASLSGSSPDARRQDLYRFAHDPDCHVPLLLMTTSGGAAGLTLTMMTGGRGLAKSDIWVLDLTGAAAAVAGGGAHAHHYAW